MTPVAASLLLTLSAPAAPALRGEKIPPALIDLVPADTAGVLVIDVPRLTKTTIGRAGLREIERRLSTQTVKLDGLLKDIDVLLIAQFAIVEFAGDFCFLAHVRDGSKLPEELLDYAERKGEDPVRRRIGKYDVYKVRDQDLWFAFPDKRTVMAVLPTGNAEETLEEAFGNREVRGPGREIRKWLEQDRPPDQPIRVFGAHKSKLGHSLGMATMPFGEGMDRFKELGDQLLSYRGWVSIGEAILGELRVTCKDQATAGRVVTDLRSGAASADPDFARDCHFFREREEAVASFRISPDLWDLLRSKWKD
ncbi:MAG TPA: hypothetical protein VKE40_22045 [Gemmataceae bacterium]|nr:hypothetical protein [Gemmataceae bacterium]